jgi:hypothetical protein
MPETFFRTAVLDDRETEIEVEIAVHSWGCDAHMGSMSYVGHPAEGPEVEIIKAWLLEETNLPNSPDISASLTDAERQRIETEFCEDPPEPDDGYDG